MNAFKDDWNIPGCTMRRLSVGGLSYCTSLGEALSAATSGSSSRRPHGYFRYELRRFFRASLPRSVLVVRILLHMQHSQPLPLLHVGLLLSSYWKYPWGRRLEDPLVAAERACPSDAQ